MLILASPLQRVTGRKRNPLTNRPLSILDIAAQVASTDRDRDQTGQRSSLIRDRRRPLSDNEICNLSERNLRPARRGDQHPLEPVGVIAQFALVADVDRIPL